jgi:hypothetical protein
MGYRRGKVQEHAVHAQPAKALHPGQLPHGQGHIANGGGNFPQSSANAQAFVLLLAERLHVFRRGFFRSEHRPQHGAQED